MRPNSDVKPPFQATSVIYIVVGMVSQRVYGLPVLNGWWGQFKSTSQGPPQGHQNRISVVVVQEVKFNNFSSNLSTLKFKRYWGAEESKGTEVREHKNNVGRTWGKNASTWTYKGNSEDLHCQSQGWTHSAGTREPFFQWQSGVVREPRVQSQTSTVQVIF